VDRLLLRYSDGHCKRRMPAEVPEIGTTVRRAGQRWIVAAIENESDTPLWFSAAKGARFAGLDPRHLRPMTTEHQPPSLFPGPEPTPVPDPPIPGSDPLPRPDRRPAIQTIQSAPERKGPPERTQGHEPGRVPRVVTQREHRQRPTG
jgi:hypothetical protein